MVAVMALAKNKMKECDLRKNAYIGAGRNYFNGNRWLKRVEKSFMNKENLN
ncbi:hypothetical protein PMI16_01869 [Herbaspirillum sp. CF444]|nr:hypothetical protein PMI16_01869 [Herbaspirillum sp. CF444]